MYSYCHRTTQGHGTRGTQWLWSRYSVQARSKILLNQGYWNQKLHLFPKKWREPQGSQPFVQYFAILVVWAATVWASVWTQFSILAAFCWRGVTVSGFHWFSTPSYWREIMFLQGQEENRRRRRYHFFCWTPCWDGHACNADGQQQKEEWNTCDCRIRKGSVIGVLSLQSQEENHYENQYAKRRLVMEILAYLFHRSHVPWQKMGNHKLGCRHLDKTKPEELVNGKNTAHVRARNGLSQKRNSFLYLDSLHNFSSAFFVVSVCLPSFRFLLVYHFSLSFVPSGVDMSSLFVFMSLLCTNVFF